MDESIRFGLFPVRSPLLGESRLISFPSGTEMFHFPELAPFRVCVPLRVTGHDSRRVAPFRNPRINGCLAPPRGLSQLTASFIAFRRQGIHPMLLSCLFSKKTSFRPYSIVNEPALADPPSSRLVRCGEFPRCLSQTPSARACGGAGRDRTDDPRLAKAVLSQLSYSPLASASPAWWAWKDLNFRPHAYQACALTT